jgi:uncharacterized protein YigE (DUF2233 family)
MRLAPALALVLFAAPAFADCDVAWRAIRPGLEYRTINCLNPKGDVDMHLFRIDLRRWDLGVDVITDRNRTARQVFNDAGAGFVMNANFFDQQGKPIGLIVDDDREVQELHESSWQSIFFVSDEGVPKIVMPDEWEKYVDDAAIAVQAGPRLVVDGEVVKVKESYASERGGVCIRRNGDLLFFITPRGRKFLMKEIASLAGKPESEGGLECRNAMLFDGGHSAQVYTEERDDAIAVSGDPVPVFLTATRK